MITGGSYKPFETINDESKIKDLIKKYKDTQSGLIEDFNNSFVLFFSNSEYNEYRQLYATSKKNLDDQNASMYDTERIEGVVSLMEEFYKQNCHVMVNALYHRWKDYSHDLKQKLFLRVYLCEYEMEYYNSISAYYLQDFESGYICCKKVIMHHKNENKLKQTFKNLLFYKSYLQKDKKFLTFIQNKVDANLYKLYLR